MRNIFAILGFLLLFYGVKNSLDNPAAEKEIANVGNGFAAYHNLKANEKFAILQPPLVGIISFSTLQLFFQFDDVSALPSQNYFDMLAFMYASEVPRLLGRQIVEKVDNFRIARLPNLLLLVVFLAILACKNFFLSGLLAALLYPVSGLIVSATPQLITSLLVITSFELMTSILKKRSSAKFALLGITIGLAMASFGAAVFILCGISICTPIIMYDWKNKSRSKGFNGEWLKDSVLCFVLAAAVAWIAYGRGLACLCQLQTLLGFAPTSSIRIIPFFDSLKQFVFEILFQPDQHVYSFKANISQFFNFKNSLLVLGITIVSLKHFNHYSLFSLALVAAAIFFNDLNHEKVILFFETVSIILTISAILLLNNISDIKKLREN
jgi:hypothetical protein